MRDRSRFSLLRPVFGCEGAVSRSVLLRHQQMQPKLIQKHFNQTSASWKHLHLLVQMLFNDISVHLQVWVLTLPAQSVL